MRFEWFGGIVPTVVSRTGTPAAGRFHLQGWPVALAACVIAASVHAQPVGRSVDNAEFRALPNHVPSWAVPEHIVAAVPAEERLQSLTLVLARHADRQQAFEALLAAQQDPGSPEYHHWLSSAEIAGRFGLSQEEIDSLTHWLESEGLHVDWIAPARNFIGFGGAAGDVARVFQTELNYYDVEGERKISLATDPLVPAEFSPLVKSVRGLSSIGEQPLSHAQVVRRDSPALTGSQNGQPAYFVAPADFAKIYDVPAAYTGKGITIGIVGGSRTDAADFDNFKKLSGTTFADPTEVVPTAYGGVDPGPPYKTQQGSGVSVGNQLEAELDVFRSASIAQEAKILLVVNKPDTNGGTNIWPDAQYLIQPDPAPAQIVNISFGRCESVAGASSVAQWDELFQTASMKGISVFVASGDSGAAGCDPYNATPPSSPAPNSPNYICSSSYATCVGGTEFNDAGNYSKYWSGSNGPGEESVLSYIPEGAWNEPSNGSGGFVASATGGGVSLVIPTPSWQTGKGVPAARMGRYTPDISYSAAFHDGYFGCMAASGGDCVDNGGFSFVAFAGTSAAAPDMAGITALLDQKMGGKQGNLNPILYAMAASTPSAFHDVTVATSGVTGCSVNTPSMCNNSTPSSTSLSGGQAGFLVTAGFDEATGLGSLDVGNFLSSYSVGKPPAAATGSASAITGTSATLSGTVNPNGASTQYWFACGTSSTLSGAAKTATATLSGSSTITVSAKVTGLKPLTKYYFQLQSSSSAGSTKGAIASFTTPKGSQTITFTQPKTPVRYGVAPFTLSARSDSGLPVTFKVVSGPGSVSGSTLTVKGVGTIAVAANQAGNTSYLAAAQVTRSITVAKGVLTVTALNKTMKQGSALPTLQFKMTGWVNGDSRTTATKGLPAIATKATSKSLPGTYPITISAGSGAGALTSSKYIFKFVNGTMTVTK